MRTDRKHGISRRDLPASGTATGAAVVLPRGPVQAAIDHRLVAGTAQASLAGPGYPTTAVWAYDGSVPGPEIRLRQSESSRPLTVYGVAADAAPGAAPKVFAVE